LQKEEETADQTRNENLARGNREFRPGNFSPIRINCLANNEWNKKAGSYAAKDTGNTDRQLEFIFSKIECKLS
jgi:hypothetical protein